MMLLMRLLRKNDMKILKVILMVCCVTAVFSGCKQDDNEKMDHQSSSMSFTAEYGATMENGENETTERERYISKDATEEYNAKASPVDDFQYIIENGKAVITKYIGTEVDVVIPSVILGKEVTSIDKEAFSPFGEEGGSPLELIKSIKIPDTVVYIGNGAFTQCSSLEYIEFPDSVLETGEYLFTFCNSLKKVKFSDQMKTIEENMLFGVSSLESVILPSGLETIEKYAFGETGIKEIIFPSSIESIGRGAFVRCINLQTISIPEGCIEIGKDAFRECTNVKTVTLPNSLKSIGDFAFFNCSNLEIINIPNSIENIGSNVFSGCGNIKH